MNESEKTRELNAMEEELLQELESYNKEKDRLKNILGQIGGKPFSRKDNLINIIFLVIILVLFTLEITTHFLPAFVSLELGILLVSVKIILMIHNQFKVNHFQFWILNSIEFRVNEMARKIRAMEKMMIQMEKRDKAPEKKD